MNATRGHVRRIARQLRDLRGVAQRVTDALVLLDHNDHVSWSNPAAESLLGISWPRDRGVRLADRLPAPSDSHGEVADRVSPIDPEIHLQVTRIPYGNRGHLLLARDISRMVKLEQVRRDFVANVSHELRTPLTVIHGYLELLDPEDVPALAPVLAEMRAQSQRMRQIVEDLLELSRLEAQRGLPQVERVEMGPLLETLRREAEALSHGTDRVTVEDTAHVDLTGSPKDLRSAFSNLVSNAVRYTPEGGSIAIRWRRTPAGAEYSVKDTGYGIPAEHLARLTERFYRVSSSRSREKGGTGLGLSIVKHILTLHHAQLRIKSTLGQGSTFSCVFDRDRLLEPVPPDAPPTRAGAAPQ